MRAFLKFKLSDTRSFKIGDSGSVNNFSMFVNSMMYEYKFIMLGAITETPAFYTLESYKSEGSMCK